MEVESLFEEHQLRLRTRADRAFGWLMLVQWAVAIVLAVSLSPYTWQGENPEIHIHVWTAILLGGIIASLPLYYSFVKPGDKAGGYVIGVAQMCFSALFIHLMGGRIETHFHVFGSLAFLSIYRNWRILVLSSALIILDHFIRGFYFPYSIYGVSTGVEWRWLEHAAWVVFEDACLIYTCIYATKEMKQTAFTHCELMNARLDTENLNIRRIQFFSVVSHEIRTPLNGIIGFTDFLKESPIPTEQKEYVSIIKQCSDTLLKLVNDLLDFTRIDSGRLDIDPHLFKTKDIRDYLENVFSLECQKKNLHFQFEISNDVPEELIGDSHRIRQVLTNLVANAIKFTETGSIQVRVRKLQPDGNVYCWCVEDTGVGIRKDYLSKIFSPYTQEHSSTARQYGGSGLGLAISKKLVELMGGQLNVDSTLGKGTTFSFTIPLKPS